MREANKNDGREAMKSFQVAEFNAPLKEVDQETPQPTGTQVLIKVKAAGVCETFQLGVAVHSSGELGIQLATMLHLGAAVPNLSYAADAHYHHLSDDIIKGGKMKYQDGAIKVPQGPGLGVELDRGRLEKLHRQYLDSGLRSRDDTGYMQRIHPAYELKCPRW